MKQKKIMLVGLMIGVLMVGVFPNFVTAKLYSSAFPSYHWNVDVGQQLAYKTIDNIRGERYIGFQVQMSGPMDMNLSLIKYNKTNLNMEPSNTTFYVTSDGLNVWSLTDNSAQFETFMFAFPLIPRVDADNTLNLAFWGQIMTNLYPGSTYGGALWLDTYQVIGNELRLFNTTTGYYCNMTFNASGILTYATFKAFMAGPGIVAQEMFVENDMSKINPLDNTAFQYPGNNRIIYEQYDQMGGMQGIFSYSIDSNTVIESNGAILREINGTAQNWDPVFLTWLPAPEHESGQIGLANDFVGNIHGGTGPVNMIYQVGTTGFGINNTYWSFYVQPGSPYRGFDQSESPSTYECIFRNTTSGGFMYWQLAPNGTLLNWTLDQPSVQFVQYIYIPDSALDMTNKTDDLEFTKIGTRLFYNLTQNSETTYGRFVISNYSYGGSGKIMGGIAQAVNITAYYDVWNATNQTWMPTPNPWGPFPEIGSQNEEEAFFVNDGPWNLIYSLDTNGTKLHNMWWGVFNGFVGFDAYEIKEYSWNAWNTGAPEWYNITLNNKTHAIEYMSYNFTGPGGLVNITVKQIAPNMIPNYPNIVPDFNYTVNNGSVNFINECSGGVGNLSYLWEFGDSTNSTAENPIHNYGTAGNFTVTLTVWDMDGNKVNITKVVDVWINIFNPNANFTFIINNGTVNFTDTTTGGAGGNIYHWIFGDGSLNSTVQNPVHNYLANGVYNVTLNVTDSNNKSGIISKNITINLIYPSNLTANFTISINNDTVNFTDTSTGGVGNLTYNWSFGDNAGNSTLKNPIHKYLANGTYIATLWVTDGQGHTDMLSKNIIIIINQPTPPSNTSSTTTNTTTPSSTTSTTAPQFNITGYSAEYILLIFIFIPVALVILRKRDRL